MRPQSDNAVILGCDLGQGGLFRHDTLPLTDRLPHIRVLTSSATFVTDGIADRCDLAGTEVSRLTQKTLQNNENYPDTFFTRKREPLPKPWGPALHRHGTFDQETRKTLNLLLANILSAFVKILIPYSRGCFFQCPDQFFSSLQGLAEKFTL